MPDNSVQSVINSQRFIRGRENHPGGGNKDFFEGQDADFRIHRAELQKQISAMRGAIAEDQFGGIAYAKVEMQRSALAKSHRPLQSVFPPARTPTVGSAGIGSLIVEVTPESLAEVGKAVERAEDVPRVVEDVLTGKAQARPSRYRSEVGAIDRVELWGPSDKRTFSSRQAVVWLADPQTGGGYLVELFDLPDSHVELEGMTPRRNRLFRSLEEGLRELGAGLRFEPLEDRASLYAMMFARIERTREPAFVQIVRGRIRRDDRRSPSVDLDPLRHEALLRLLDAHPLVRTISLPPKVVSSDQEFVALGMPADLPEMGNGAYPRVGVIDGGIGESLSPWILDRIGLLAEEDRNEPHGTFISGLLVAGQNLNPHLELVGCQIFDIDVFPLEASFPQYYPKGVADFFDEVEAAIVRARTAHGIRVFNLSLNLTSPASPQTYHYFAARLDDLADKHDVILVISAGNLDPSSARGEWTGDLTQNLALLANSRSDGILTPAERVRHISVSALNPPGHPGCVPLAPAAYTRRGPGLSTGVKPDVAHIGGALLRDSVISHGLTSILPTGETTSGCGTSYAAPLVARTLAQLEVLIEGDVRRETLVALMVHGAAVPDPLDQAELEVVARDLVGFGMPRLATEILTSAEHEMTLVFEGRILPITEMVFPFSWPQSLVDERGACRGGARMTLVTTPPLDMRYGAEFVRINLDAALQQERNGVYASKLSPTFLPSGMAGSFEKDLIDHALKWGPIKTYRGRFPRGIGRTSNWRIHISSLVRALDIMPVEGVPFTLVLAVSDLDETAPIFRELRQSLLSLGAVTTDIRTAFRLQARA